MVFETTKLIEEAYKKDECSVFLPYGPLGIGKSSYALKVLYQLYGSWEEVKKYLVFHPQDFVRRTEEMMERGEKQKALVWDDAGLWLYSLEYHHPFVKAVTKYLNVARTNWSGIIFTTPLPTWVLRKVRGFPQAVTLKIIKTSSDITNPNRQRMAKAYRYWVTPDMKKSGVVEIYRDSFSALLPNSFYWEYYKPLRDSYAQQAIRGMKRELWSVLSDEPKNNQ